MLLHCCYEVRKMWLCYVMFWIICEAQGAEYRAQFIMSDNTGAGTTIGNILDASVPKFPLSTYQIIVQKSSYGRFDRYFRITDDGRVFTALSFDRDDVNYVCGPLLCCDKEICRVDVHVIVTHKATQREYPVEVSIEVRDENDNAPKFMETSATITIRENERAPFSKHRLPLAIDTDSPIFGIKNYYLEGRNNQYFKLTGGKYNPIIEASKTFDFENVLERQFQLNLVAEDHGGKSAKLRLLIAILDVNDNRPVFTNTAVNLTLKENTSYSGPIFMFEAHDLDSGKNGKLAYYFSATVMPNIRTSFKLKPDTGELFLQRKLDYEMYTQRAFSLTVEAVDHGIPEYSAFCNMQITVLDINDNDPLIEVTYRRNLPENTKIIDPVLKFTVRDDDSIDNAVSCSVVEPNPFGLVVKRMVAQNFFVYTTKSYDYEERHNVSVRIVCKDSAIEPRAVNQSLLVYIEDKNDNSPQFNRTVFLIDVREDVLPNSTITSVLATDADSGAFGAIQYVLNREWDHLFRIDETRGVIRTQKSLDRETVEEHSLQILARDGGGLETSCTVVVRVLDVNDHAPKLAMSPLLYVRENSPPGTMVGHIEVSDPDLNENGQVNWTVKFHEQASKFLVLRHGVNGSYLATLRVIDREKHARFSMSVFMSDRGTPLQASIENITVEIEDENDNVPEIIAPRKGELIENFVSGVILAENTPRFTDILSVQTRDPDHGNNGLVLFHMLPCNGSRFFTINKTSGQVSTDWNYDRYSFTPTFPKQGIYKISYAAFNQVKASNNESSSNSSHFFLRVGQYRQMLDSGYSERYKRPFFSNVVLLILIGGFTISLAAALIAAIVWAKAKFTSESTVTLDTVTGDDGSKFVMMLMNDDATSTVGGGGGSQLYPPSAGGLNRHQSMMTMMMMMNENDGASSFYGGAPGPGVGSGSMFLAAPHHQGYGRQGGGYYHAANHPHPPSMNSGSQYLYDPYASMLAANGEGASLEGGSNSQYPTLTQSHSTTFNSRRGKQHHQPASHSNNPYDTGGGGNHGEMNGGSEGPYDIKTMPAQRTGPPSSQHYHMSPSNQPQTLSPSMSNSSNQAYHIQNKNSSSFYRTFEDDPQCRDPRARHMMTTTQIPYHTTTTTTNDYHHGDANQHQSNHPHNNGRHTNNYQQHHSDSNYGDHGEIKQSSSSSNGGGNHGNSSSEEQMLLIDNGNVVLGSSTTAARLSSNQATSSLLNIFSSQQNESVENPPTQERPQVPAHYHQVQHPTTHNNQPHPTSSELGPDYALC